MSKRVKVTLKDMIYFKEQFEFIDIAIKNRRKKEKKSKTLNFKYSTEPSTF